MSWFIDFEMPFYVVTHKPDVAQEVEQFVSCRLVGEIEVGGVEQPVMHPEL